jgi:AraC-like DNA-binding protein
MTRASSAPAPELKILEYSRADDFRPVRNLTLDFTPLAIDISARQTILNLPGCDISLVSSFPRITDASVKPDCTLIAFVMDQGAPIRFNGVEKSEPAIVIGAGGASFSTVERAPRQYVGIAFTPEVRDRGWPAAKSIFQIFETSPDAHRRLQELVMQVLSAAEGLAQSPWSSAAATSIRESLLAAVDGAFADVMEKEWTSRANAARQYKIFRDVQAAISADWGRPIYSAELAEQIGVSVRTVQNAVQKYRGMSLHRYLRLRRLWLVRKRLLAGTHSVKDVALSMGFWHLGDFSNSYRTAFGETPSETLARSR